MEKAVGNLFLLELKFKEKKIKIFFFFVSSSSSSGPFHISQLAPSLKRRKIKIKKKRGRITINYDDWWAMAKGQQLSQSLFSSASCCWWTISQSLNAWITHTHGKSFFSFRIYRFLLLLVRFLGIKQNKRLRDGLMVQLSVALPRIFFYKFLDVGRAKKIKSPNLFFTWSRGFFFFPSFP